MPLAVRRYRNGPIHRARHLGRAPAPFASDGGTIDKAISHSKVRRLKR